MALRNSSGRKSKKHPQGSSDQQKAEKPGKDRAREDKGASIQKGMPSPQRSCWKDSTNSQSRFSLSTLAASATPSPGRPRGKSFDRRRGVKAAKKVAHGGEKTNRSKGTAPGTVNQSLLQSRVRQILRGAMRPDSETKKLLQRHGRHCASR